VPLGSSKAEFLKEFEKPFPKADPPKMNGNIINGEKVYEVLKYFKMVKLNALRE
jgi:hypothetical protein